MKNKPIIILGSHRSGSKLLARMLGSCQGTFLVTEHIDKNEIPEDRSGIDDSILWWTHFDFSRPGVPPNNPPLVEEAKYDEHAISVVRGLYEQMANGQRLIMKNPQHLIRLPLLREIFPDARFVYIVRNPWHVIQSMNIKYWAPQRRHRLATRIINKLSLRRLLEKRKAEQSGMRKQYPAFVLRTMENYLLPNDLLLKSANSWGTAISIYLKERNATWNTVVYEKLLQDPEVVVRGLCHDLGLIDDAGISKGISLVRNGRQDYTLIAKKYAASRYKDKVREEIEEGCRLFDYPLEPQ